MIVKDEESTLPTCLDSVQGVADELIVVDTGSQDRTADVARQFGATVYDFPWQDDFAAARNYALQYAQGDWILVLDADEVWMSSCTATLRQVIQDSNRLAVTLLREELGAQQTPYTLVSRLFRRHPQIQFQRPYHETIDDSIEQLMQQEPHWIIADVPMVAIAHHGYHPDLIARHHKAERAERIMERYLTEHPQDAYLCSKLGALYITQGRTDEGLRLLKQGLASQPRAAAVVYELHYHLGLAYVATQTPMLAQQHYEQALATPLPAQLKLAAYINLAALYSDAQAWTQAEALLSQVLTLQPDFAIAHYNQGLLYRAKGNLPAAIAAYQRAIALQPNAPEAYQNLGVAYLKQGQIPESLTAFLQAITLYTIQNPAEAQRLQQTLAEMGWQV